MCGLFGVIHSNGKLDPTRCEGALETLNHRGPDHTGIWRDNSIFIGHKRLSIIDLSENGQQPMISSDGNVVMSINGEIYNFKSLRKELSKEFNFRGNSDSEVVLYGYIKWGIERLLKKLDGMFAFIIYDRKINKIYGARDRSGIKPLYYNLSNNLIWSSELKGIVEYLPNLEVDKEAIYDYFTYRYIPTPKTCYKHTFKLPPANYFEYCCDSHALNIRKYWKLECVTSSITIEEASVELRSLVSKSVGSQLMSDVPVGFFLSGGMDSSVVVSEASNLIDKVNTYTIGFHNKNDESGYANIVAKSFNTNHMLKYSDSDYHEMFKLLPVWYDEPYADTSAFPSFIVSEIAKENSTVVLTGDGGDELFGGYNKYMIFKKLSKNIRFNSNYLKSFAANLKNSNKRILKALGSRFQTEMLFNDFELLTSLMSGKIKEEKVEFAKMLNISHDYDDYWYFRKHYNEELPILTRLQYMDFMTYLPDDILTKVDRVSMANSLETRVPFLSNEIIDFVFRLPEAIRYLNGELKGLLKQVYSKDLPKEILIRGKKGFSVPANLYLRDAKGKSELEEILGLFKLAF